MLNDLPKIIDCIEISEPGKSGGLRPTTRPMPRFGPAEILIRVVAAGVNRPDVFQRKGLYPPPAGVTDIPGLEVSGTVAALGKDVEGWHEGDPITALVAGGGYAEYCVAPAPQCLPVPRGLETVEAAALPETCFTVWHNVFDRGALKSGESLLVHGGSSGIGTTAIQMARAYGARVIATAGSKKKCAACRNLGAEIAVNYQDEDFVAAAKAFTDGRGVDVVLDMVGGDYVQRNLKALGPDGRLVQIAFLNGSKVEIDLMPVMLKRLIVTGSTLRARPVAEKAKIAAALRTRVWPLIEHGTLRPIIHATFPLARASDAHYMMESSQHIGKIVLTV